MPLTAARLSLLLLAVFASVLLVNLGTLWSLTDRIFQTELAPVVQNKGFVVGDTLARRLEDAVQLGVPLDELVDLDALLAAMLADDRQVAAVAINDTQGRTLYRWRAAWASASTLSEDTPTHRVNEDFRPRISLPLAVEEAPVGSLELVTTADYLRVALQRLGEDLLLAWLAVLLLGWALLIQVLGDRRTLPGDSSQRQTRSTIFLLGVTLGLNLLHWPLPGTLLDGGVRAALPILLSGVGSAALLLLLGLELGTRGTPRWWLGSGTLLTTLGLLVSRTVAPHWPWWVTALIGAGLGLSLGASDCLAGQRRDPDMAPAQRLLCGLGVGLILGQLVTQALPSNLHTLLLAGFGGWACVLGYRATAIPVRNTRPTGSENRLLLIGIGARLPIQAVTLGVPLLLLLPWSASRLMPYQQARLLAGMALLAALALALGEFLGRRLGGGLVVTLGGFLAGAVLLTIGFIDNPSGIALLALLLAAGLGLSLGGQRTLAGQLAAIQGIPTNPYLHRLAVLGAPGLILGPPLALLGIVSIGVVESLIGAGLLLVLATLICSVGLLLLGGDDTEVRGNLPTGSAGP